MQRNGMAGEDSIRSSYGIRHSRSYRILGADNSRRLGERPMTTICSTCGNLYLVNRSDAWYRWLCLAAPRQKWENPVTGLTVADPPYSFCKHLNDGECANWKPGVNHLSPDKLVRNSITGEHPKKETEA